MLKLKIIANEKNKYSAFRLVETPAGVKERL